MSSQEDRTRFNTQTAPVLAERAAWTVRKRGDLTEIVTLVLPGGSEVQERTAAALRAGAGR